MNWQKSMAEVTCGGLDIIKVGDIQESNCSVELPDEGWSVVNGKTEDLGKIYDEIYKDGNLTYEIEMFTDDGDCEIWYLR